VEIHSRTAGASRQCHAKKLQRKTEMRELSKGSLRCVGLAVSVVAMVTSGCAVGPNYERPEVQTAAGYRPATTQTSQEQPPEVQWWRTFGDPMLDRYIVAAWK